MLVKKLLVVLCSLFSYTVFAQCEVLVWSDEFNGIGSPNSTYWNFDLGQSGWGNQEIQNYTNSTTNCRQEDGRLIIDAIKTGTTWTSARIKTQNKLSFKYGKIVFRAKLPTGVGTWPALWTLGDNITTVGWPACGEIDIMEHVGRNQNVVQAALHNPSSYGNTQNKGSKTISTASTEFHEYAVSWNAERMVFSIDNIPYYTYSPSPKTAANWPYDAGQFIIMNLAIGGTFGGSVDPNLTSARFEIDYVRVYEERSEPIISGSQFVFEKQQGVKFTAPDYGNDIVYTWTVPNDATLVSGQGTKEITVDWGQSDGPVLVALTGETGCLVNSTSLAITTIVNPSGSKFTVEDFTNPQLPGWSKNDNGITYSLDNKILNVSYALSGLKYVQYEMPRAVNFSDYGILKIPISIPSSSSIPKLLLTFRDGNGNETITSNFDIPIKANDGEFYTYSYNFNGLWALNNPNVNPNYIKSLRVYMLAGQGAFQLGTITVFNSTTIPSAPHNLSTSITETGENAIHWSNDNNATSFNLYRSDSPSGNYIKLVSNITTSEVPYIITSPQKLNYYKLSGVNAIGESALSNAIEVIALITSEEGENNTENFIYPNPSNGRFFIQSQRDTTKSITIYNSSGIKQEYDMVYDESRLIVELKKKTPGIYFIIFTEEFKTRIAKIAVQ
jgi:beta-glucanase (GH16 family)